MPDDARYRFRRMTVGEAIFFVVLWPGITFGAALILPVPFAWVLLLTAAAAVVTLLWCIKGLTVGVNMSLSNEDKLLETMKRAYPGRPEHELRAMIEKSKNS